MGISFILMKKYEEADMILYFWQAIESRISGESFINDENAIK